MDIPPAGWTGIAGALGTALATAIGWWSTRDKTEADVAQVLTQTASEWIEDLQTERREQRDTIRELRAEVAELRVEIHDCETRHDGVAEELGRMATWMRSNGLDYPGAHE